MSGNSMDFDLIEIQVNMTWLRIHQSKKRTLKKQAHCKIWNPKKLMKKTLQSSPSVSSSIVVFKPPSLPYIISKSCRDALYRLITSLPLIISKTCIDLTILSLLFAFSSTSFCETFFTKVKMKNSLKSETCFKWFYTW